MDVWLLLRLLAFATTPVWVFCAAWGLLVGVPTRVLTGAGPGRSRGPAADLPPDPFRTLRLQQRLTALAAELDVLAADGTAYARATKLAVVSGAYDDVLDDACALAGVPTTSAPGVRPEVDRIRREAALRAAGWTW